MATEERLGHPGAPAVGFGRRVAQATGVALLVLVIATILWFAIDVLLLVFAAVLIATLLRAQAVGDLRSLRAGGRRGAQVGVRSPGDVAALTRTLSSNG